MDQRMKQAYEACPVGAQAAILPRSDSEVALTQFQQEVAAAEGLAKARKIRIVKRHVERETGKDFVDLVVFERIE